MVKISALKTGDQIQCWLPSGRALELVSDVHGKLYYQAPNKVRSRTKPNAITKFWAIVQSNNTKEKVLLLHIQPFFNSKAIPAGQSAAGRVHYSTFQRVRLASSYAHLGKATDPIWPTKYTALANREFAPYRTLEEVSLV